MKNIKINWFNTITIIISIIALFFSYLSWDMSKQTHGYEVAKDSAINTPAITEIVDSTKISFRLNNSAELQNMAIVFPNTVTDEIVTVMSKPIDLYKIRIETLAKNYLRGKLKVRDSTELVGTFSIPVMMNYSAIVYGQPYSLRENRFLIFNIHYYDNVENVTFTNSFLVNRGGYPLKQHYFFTGPFAEPLEKKVYEQDSVDVQELLEVQLKNISKNLLK